MKADSISEQIDTIIATHGGWKGEQLTRLRAVIAAADPGVFEEVKWRMPTRPEGLPVWSCNGIVCFAEIWKDNVKLIFPKGAKLKDPKGLFNSRLQSKDIRAIELKEESSVDEAALKELVLEAITLNGSLAK
jgi:hypothetical protein